MQSRFAFIILPNSVCLSLCLGFKKSTFSIISLLLLLLLLSLVRAGPVEKCVTELKTANIQPGEREVIKGQARKHLNVLRRIFFSSSSFSFPLLDFVTMTCQKNKKKQKKKRVGTVERRLQWVRGGLRPSSPSQRRRYSQWAPCQK